MPPDPLDPFKKLLLGDEGDPLDALFNVPPVKTVIAQAVGPVEPFEIQLTEEMLVSDPALQNAGPANKLHQGYNLPASEQLVVTRVANGWILAAVNDKGEKVGKAFVASSPQQLGEIATQWGNVTHTA